ncbi:hypothetical protein [Pelagibius sp.]|uniref:hypothetical protein n=1 Tax=Pelagibius sp. TaxID=1931238 RepID=UPI003BAE1783
MVVKPAQRRLAASVFAAALLGGSPVLAADGWEISQSGRDFSFNTASGLSTSKGVSRAGLVSVMRRGGKEMLRFWPAGGYRETVILDGEVLVDGSDLEDVSRVSGLRMDRKGSHVYLRTTKGPKARVELIQDGQTALTWPRLQIVSVLAYDERSLTVSVFEREKRETTFLRYRRSTEGRIEAEAARIGSFSDCTVLSAKVLRAGIGLEVFCDPRRGSDVVLLDFASGKITPVLASQADEFLGFSLGRPAGAIPVISVSGSQSARQAYHALSGALLHSLGEPMARASDEAGKQSWSQSYRTLVLAELFRKSGHPVFADLAVGAMTATLDRQNKAQGIEDRFNPPCAWASRIYSLDRRSPVSFMINQAMISASLLQSCAALGERCPLKLRAAILANAQCLVQSYEPYFDQTAGLYRIPRGAPFRFDGLWAPWNWHLRWAVVLERVGELLPDPALVARAHTIADSFVESWEVDSGGALWRYWVPAHYRGWTKADQISLHRPEQKAAAPKRYEDINHAGISLLGLSSLSYRLGPDRQAALQRTLDRLLAAGSVLPRDLDGRGPRTPRWLPGAGWHAYATDTLKDLYSRRLPGSVSSDQHLAYALLFDPAAPFDLDLTLSYCGRDACGQQRRWSFASLRALIEDNPLFTITPLP